MFYVHVGSCPPSLGSIIQDQNSPSACILPLPKNHSSPTMPALSVQTTPLLTKKIGSHHTVSLGSTPYSGEERRPDRKGSYSSRARKIKGSLMANLPSKLDTALIEDVMDKVCEVLALPKYDKQDAQQQKLSQQSPRPKGES